MIVPPPEGPGLTAEQARLLDDEFLGSDPTAYFRSRIRTLLTQAQEPDLSRGVGADFAAALSCPELSELLEVSERDQQLQVAVDALSLRHHAAEAALRLYYGLAVAEPTSVGHASLWAALSDGPRQLGEVVGAVEAHLRSQDGRDGLWRLLVPAELAAEAEPDALSALNEAVTCAGRWLLHACLLLSRDDVSHQVAHNKVKHGLATRTRSDRQAMATIEGPENGTIPLRAFRSSAAVELVGSVSLAYLARPRKGGLELCTVNVPPAVVLAEAWLMASVHGAMFQEAARRHFEGREHPLSAPRVRLHPGPSPTELLGDRVLGLRFPVTHRPDGGEARPAGISTLWSFLDIAVDHDQHTTAEVIDDEG